LPSFLKDSPAAAWIAFGEICRPQHPTSLRIKLRHIGLVVRGFSHGDAVEAQFPEIHRVLYTQARAARRRIRICKDKIRVKTLPDLGHRVFYRKYAGFPDDLT